ncbi:PREDICTED: uncharacterized protein LOC104600918 [Nelumbo nucifera]|uniref:Uncharacterized protein LOC104600918 n=2 Tax=Nelumbo nucifera TaxID=4432 RepID=A0A1U8AJH5_NELNU|nr:PREDICTED: uncharacterized protein LOC104600918 [Nelumbo nucifera]DAD35207.1 TPA_asm: hypothetical protein HUJ06_005847 [Nelumbo nucifera]
MALTLLPSHHLINFLCNKMVQKVSLVICILLFSAVFIPSQVAAAARELAEAPTVKKTEHSTPVVVHASPYSKEKSHNHGHADNGHRTVEAPPVTVYYPGDPIRV